MNDPAILARIKQYELAYRMQTAVPELADIAAEPQAVREAYGAEPGRCPSPTTAYWRGG